MFPLEMPIDPSRKGRIVAKAEVLIDIKHDLIGGRVKGTRRVGIPPHRGKAPLVRIEVAAVFFLGSKQGQCNEEGKSRDQYLAKDAYRRAHLDRTP